MNIPGYIILWIFFILAGVLLVIAVSHLILGLKHGHGSKVMAISSAIFLGFIILIGWLSWSLLRQVDWSAPLFIGQTDTVTDQSL